MLTTKCIHPELMAILSSLGHHDKILIADGNFPLESQTGTADKVFLGLKPGMPTVTDVLDALLGVIKVEAAEVMETSGPDEPEIFAEFREMLPELTIEKIGYEKFFDICNSDTLRLAISTGEKRTYSNILLTVGVA